MTAPKPLSMAIIVTPMMPTLLIWCSMLSMPCFGLLMGKGLPIFQKSRMKAAQTAKVKRRRVRFSRQSVELEAVRF